MIYTVESRENQNWTIYQGTIVNRGPFISALNLNDCVIITGNEGLNFIPPPAFFDADSNLILKAVRLTFPGAPALRPIADTNNVNFFFRPMLKAGGVVPGMAEIVYTAKIDTGYWEWLEIPDFQLPAIENAYWDIRSRYTVTPDFLNVSTHFVGATYKIRTGLLIETAKGPYYV